MATLNVRLLGPPQAERDGKPVEVATRKVMALLAYLAVTGQRHSRDALAALLLDAGEELEAQLDAHTRATLTAVGPHGSGGWLAYMRRLLGSTEGSVGTP